MSSVHEDDVTLICAICRDGLVNPRTLPCYHSFCLDCLTRASSSSSSSSSALAATAAASGSAQIPTCPLCRTTFSIPTGGLPALPTDSLISQLIKRRETPSTLNPNDVVTCACEEEPAEIYCPSCEAFFGAHCLKSHQKTKRTCTHETVTLAAYFEKRGSGDITPRVFCETHQASELDMFCETCQAVLCAHCAVAKHGKHDVVSLTDQAAKAVGMLKTASDMVRVSLWFFAISFVHVVLIVDRRSPGEPSQGDC